MIKANNLWQNADVEKKDIYTAKNEVQQQALEKWRQTRKGTVVLATGSGKTRVGVLAAAECSGNVLVVVPTTNLRDNEWPNEFNKWNVSRENVTIECVQTVYKNWENYDVDLLIVDEIHTTLSDKYSRIYNIPYKQILGLTATPPEDKEYYSKLEALAPILTALHVTDAVKKGLVSPFKLYNLPVKFTKKERWMYKKFDSMFKKASNVLSREADKHPELSAFDIAKELQNRKLHPLYRYAKDFWAGMSMRKWVCYKAEHKVDACLDIVQKFPDMKWIIFAKNTDFADTVHERLDKLGIPNVVYHSKMSTTDRQQALEDAKKDEIRVLCTAEALNAGYDLPAIDGGICAAGPSVLLNFTQQLGRTLRYEDNKQAVFINLYVKWTQEEKWVEKKTRTFSNVKWIDSVHEINP